MSKYTKLMDDEQREGVAFLTKTGRGILGDEIGFGKTLQIIAACEGKRRVLVVVAPGVAKIGWSQEIGKWTDDEWVILDTVKDFDRASKTTKWFITHNESLRAEFERDEDGRKTKKIVGADTELGRLLWQIPWSALVVDEAHNFVNRKSGLGAGMLHLARRVPSVIMATGTPIMNQAADIWTLLHAVAPAEFKSYWKFVQRYANARPGDYGWVIDKEPSNVEEMRKVIAPYFIRRELKTKPKRIDTYPALEPDPEQDRMAREMKDDLMIEIGDSVFINPHQLARITHLRQLALCPKILGAKQWGVKFESAGSQIVGSGRKWLVFSTLATGLRFFQEYLDTLGVKMVMFDSDTPLDTREKIIDSFRKDDEIRALGMTYKAGGASITINEASGVQALDEPWNPPTAEQGFGRCYRRGQDKDVLIVHNRLGWIDDFIKGLLSMKQKISDDVIGVREEDE